jgi:L-glyceraldehyde 3-phosphate reductase
VAQLEQNIAAVQADPLSADELAAIEPFVVDGTGRR